ncbi:MAG: hypothetical protein L3J65_13110, partial [Robiginitomaculum sp.]|nr:hypothetical protein [Robiginitomaculum sp.]
KNVLIIEVREGNDKPYRCASGFYNRIGPNSQKLRRNEIIEFVQSEGKIRFDELVFRDFNESNFDKGKLTGWTCIFWQDPSTAYFASSSKGHPQSPVIGSDGSTGSLPVIKETKNVSFKSEFKAGLVVRQLRKKDVTVSLVTGGKINGKWVGNITSFQRKKWDESDSITLAMAGGKFKLKAIRPNTGAKPTAVDVEVITVPKPAALGSLNAEDQMKLLEILLKVAKQKGEGK